MEPQPAARPTPEQLRAVVSEVDEIALELDDAGRCVDVWAGDASLLLQPAGGARGATLEDLLGAEAAPAVDGAVRRAVARGQPQAVEVQVGDGEALRWLRVRLGPIPAADGRSATVVLYARDVTEARRREHALRAMEARYRTLIEQLPAVFYVDDAGEPTRPIYVSPQLEDMLGMRIEEWLADTHLWRRYLHPDDRDEAVAVYEAGVASGRPFDQEYRIVRDDGRVVHVLERVAPARGDDGEVVSWQAVLLDVTELRATEAALRSSEASARNLFERNPLPMWVWDPSTYRFLDVNEAARRQYGYTREEFLAMTALDIRPAEERDRLRTEVTLEADLKHYGLWRHLRKDGSELTVDVWSTLVRWDDRDARLSIALDVTDRLRAEQALQEAEERYRSLVESIPAAVYLDRIDDGTTVYIGPQIEDMLGYPPEEWLARADLWLEVLHPDERDRWLADVAARGEAEPFDAEYRLTARDGRTVWVRDQAVPVPDANGRPTYRQGFLTDITERKVAEAQLREAEERSRLVLDNISDLVALVGLDGRIVYASPSHRDVLGVDPAALVGEEAFAREPEDDAERSRRSFARAVAGERTPPERFRLLDADGHPRHMEGTGWQPIRGDDGTVSAVLAVSRDVTERERVERERREMLSRIVAAGEEERRRIADDVHDAPIQALTALGIRLETLRSRLPDPDAHELLDRVESSVESSIASLRTLMFELRPPVLDREGLVPALRDYLAGVVDQHAPGFAYEVHDRLAREPAPGSRIVLYRIVQEAIVNVRKHAGASRVAVTVASVDGGTSVRVEDDGSGLPGELAPRPGHIGISAMRERAEYAGGRFSVTGRAGGGTVVEAWVPER